MVENIRLYNSKVNELNRYISKYLAEVTLYNDAYDVIYSQYELYDSFSWVNQLFYSQEFVVSTTLPTKPTAPTPLTDTPPPSIADVNWKGGAGSPISGEYSLIPADNGKKSYKYFGVLGQVSSE